MLGVDRQGWLNRIITYFEPYAFMFGRRSSDAKMDGFAYINNKN